MITCTKCGRQNESRYKFCLGCGNPLTASQAVLEPAGAVVGSYQPVISEAAQSRVHTQPLAEVKAGGSSPGLQPLPSVEEMEEGDTHLEMGPGQVSVVVPVAVRAPEEEARVCSDCGTLVPPQFVFCGRCGTRYVAVEPEEDRIPIDTVVASPVRARLIVIHPDGREGEAIALVDGENVIGRKSIEALAEDPFVSMAHVRLLCDESGVLVEDNHSSNGTFVRIVAPVTLANQDCFRVGQEVLRFTTDAAREPVLVADDDTPVLGSPESEGWGYLHLMIDPHQDSNVYRLCGDEVVIGRELGGVVFRDDGFVSGRHARLMPLGAGARLEDLGSSNGTYVRLRGPLQLQDGEHLLIGRQLLRLHVRS